MSLDRFEQRRRSGRRRTVWRVALALLAVAVVAVGVWAIWFSSVFAVRDVRVSGTETLTKAQVERRAQVPIGRPLARVDGVSIEERISRIARIESVEVDRSWPHTISITVVERKPVAWTRRDGRIQLVDRYGVDYRAVSKQPRGLVEITGNPEDARSRQQALEESAEVIARLRRDSPRIARAVRSVEADTKDSVTLKLTKGRTVTWGSAAKFDDKIKVLTALLDIRARVYDVSAPEQPTTKR